MSLFNRNKTSSSSSTSSLESTVNTVDNRVGGDNAVFGGNVTVTPTDSPIKTLQITTTDQGALLAARDLSGEAFNFASQAEASNKSLASDLTKQAFDLAQSARSSESANAIQTLSKYLAVIAVVGIVAYAYKRSRA